MVENEREREKERKQARGERLPSHAHCAESTDARTLASPRRDNSPASSFLQSLALHDVGLDWRRSGQHQTTANVRFLLHRHLSGCGLPFPRVLPCRGLVHPPCLLNPHICTPSAPVASRYTNAVRVDPFRPHAARRPRASGAGILPGRPCRQWFPQLGHRPRHYRGRHDGPELQAWPSTHPAARNRYLPRRAVDVGLGRQRLRAVCPFDNRSRDLDQADFDSTATREAKI